MVEGTAAKKTVPGFLHEGGEMGALMRNYDWEKTSLGSPFSWPDTLKTSVATMLRSPYPMFLWWGKELIMFHNDAFVPILGKRHPDALGKSAPQVWSDVWDVVAPFTNQVLETGKPCYYEKLMLIPERKGFKEETYFTFAYSPLINSEGEVAGLYCVCSEDTNQVLSNRRLTTLHKLSKIAAPGSVKEVFEIAAAIMATNRNDMPFCLLYSLQNKIAVLEASFGIEPPHPAAPPSIDLSNISSWPLAEAATYINKPFLLKDIGERFPPSPARPIEDISAHAVILSLVKSGQEQPLGFFISGVSPRLEWNSDYSNFLTLVAGQLSTALTNITLLEEERKRAIEAQEAVRMSETQLRAVLEATPECIKIVDANGNLQYMNHAGLCMIEADVDNPPLGSCVYEVITEEYREEWKKNHARVCNGESLAWEFDIRGFSGTTRRMETHAVPLPNGDGRFSQLAVTRDVTVRKEAERALKENEKQLQKLAEASIAIAAAPDLSSALHEITERARQIIGAHQSVTSMTTDKDWSQAINAVSLSEKYAAWRNYEHPTDGSGIYSLVCSQKKPMRLTQEELENHPAWRGFGNESKHHPPMRGWLAVPLTSKDGSNIGLIQLSDKYEGDFSAADEAILTQFAQLASTAIEKAKAEEAVKESEERFRTLANNIRNLAWMADGDGWVYWYNNRWYEYTGTTAEEMQGWGWQKVHHPDHVDRVVSYAEQAWKKNEPFDLTFPLRGKDGEYRWFLTRVYPVCNEDGKVIHWIGTNTDITEQKKAEERFRLLADQSPMWVWMTDDNVNVTYANREILGFLGLSDHTAITPAFWRKVIHPDDLHKFYKVFRDALEKQKTYSLECRFRNGENGDYEWFLLKGVPRTEEGLFSGFIGTAINIHGQKTLLEELEMRVLERTRELNMANTALQRSNEDLQQFAHVASHDLKEPARKVKTFGSRISDELGSQLPEKGRVYLQKIDGAADRMFALIEGVLKYSSLSAEEQTAEPVDLNRTISEVADDLEVLIQEKKAVIRYERLPVLKGSNILLHQLFYNIINNSLKFSKADVPPVIEISAEGIHSPLGDETGLPDTNFSRIMVKDNGIGFEQEDAAKIFRTFYRLNSKDRYEGTGLGLSLCKKIAERHGGSIEAEGRPGEGALFKIILPVAE